MNRFSLCASALVFSSIVGCNTDAAVFVDPTVEKPALSIAKAALGTNVTGSFTLRLHLSARAAGPSQVSLTSFSIQSADQKTTFADGLPFQSDKPSPIAVAEDSDTVVTITVDTTKMPLAPAVHDTACAAGQIVVSGVLSDSLQTHATTFVSEPFAPTGC